MHICIDSCVFIRGIRTADTTIIQVLAAVGPRLQLYIPRLVAQEVTRNLRSPQQVRQFYQIFHQVSFAFIIDDPVPESLVNKYTALGLPAKADAFIGAFAEWMGVRYLISDNRHFLRALRTDAFKVVDAETFLDRWEARTL